MKLELGDIIVTKDGEFVATGWMVNKEQPHDVIEVRRNGVIMEPKKEYIRIEKCPICGKNEYVGMMYWRDGKQMCRHCMMKIWKEKDKSKCDDFKYYFPLYENGLNYSEEEQNGKNSIKKN